MNKSKIKNAIDLEFSDKKERALADKLVEPISDLLIFGEYDGRMDKRHLTRTLFRQAKNNEKVLSEYREFKSSMGIIGFLAWPIFKMILMWVIRELIKNWGE